jgi:hypothetical protein
MGKCIMKKTALMIGITTALAISSSTVFAANANTTQKGSLLIFPKIDVRTLVGTSEATSPKTTTWVQIVNDSVDTDVRVKCYYMDVAKNRLDFEFDLSTKETYRFNAKNGFPTDRPNPGYGELICFAVNRSGAAAIPYNNLSGTATVVRKNYQDGNNGAVQYNAWAFRYNGTTSPIANGTLVLNGTTAYDSCPKYLFGQFFVKGTTPAGMGQVGDTQINISTCQQDLRQDYNWNVTKLQFDIYKRNEDRLTGAYECANSYFEDYLSGIDTGSQNFASLKGYGYYRVSGVYSTQCNGYNKVAYQPSDVPVTSTATGLVGVQTTYLKNGAVATPLGASQNAHPPGFVKWEPGNAGEQVIK